MVPHHFTILGTVILRTKTQIKQADYFLSAYIAKRVHNFTLQNDESTKFTKSAAVAEVLSLRTAL